MSRVRLTILIASVAFLGATVVIAVVWANAPDPVDTEIRRATDRSTSLASSSKAEPSPSTASSPSPQASSSASPPTDDEYSEMVRAQFDVYEGGEPIDPCGLRAAFRPPVDLPFFGDQATYGGHPEPYLHGDGIVWCVVGFAAAIPIDVAVTAPSGDVRYFQMVMREHTGALCRSLFDACPASDYLHLSVNENATARYVVRASRGPSGLAAALAGWVFPDSPTGKYQVEAVQRGLAASSTIVVKRPRRPVLTTTPWVSESGTLNHTVLVAGHQAGTEVGLYVFELKSYGWRYKAKLSDVRTNDAGSATYHLDPPSGSRWSAGEYCILTAQTVPEQSDAEPGPCWRIGRHSGWLEVPIEVAQDDLANRTYVLDFGEFTLTGGFFIEWNPDGPLAGNHKRVTIVEPTIIKDLDIDGDQDALVLLARDVTDAPLNPHINVSTASMYLTVLENWGSQLVEVSTIHLGDRLEVADLAVKSNAVEVSTTTAGSREKNSKYAIEELIGTAP